MNNRGREVRDKESETDKETTLNILKEEFNHIQQKKSILKEHDIIIKE